AGRGRRPLLPGGWEPGRPAGSRRDRCWTLQRSETDQALRQAAAFGQFVGGRVDMPLTNPRGALLPGAERRPSQQLLAVSRADSVCPLHYAVQVDVLELQATRIELEEAPASIRVRQRQLDGQVDAARSCGQRGLEDVRPVGCQHEDDVAVVAQAVHFVQQLEE